MVENPVARYGERPETVLTESGNGPAVVFVHGMLMDRTQFYPQLSDLSDTYRTIAYDLRARTDQYNEPYDLSALADDLAALLDALDIGSIVLAGVSMGGFMALRFVDNYPERVRAIVLINSMAEAHTAKEREEYRRLAAQVRTQGMSTRSILDISREKLFGETTLEKNTALVEHWEARWRTYPAEAVHNAIHSWIDRDDFTPRCSDISVPVLSVHGEEDRVLGPERTESLLTVLPHGQEAVIPEAGHSVPIEQPDQLNAILRAFLSDIADN